MTSNDFQIIAVELKKDIITSVGSMFVEVKSDMKSMEARLEGKIDKLGGKFNSLENKFNILDNKVDILDDKLTHGGIAIEEIREDVKAALEAQTKILAHEGIVKNHEERLQFLETDMKALKSTP